MSADKIIDPDAEVEDQEVDYDDDEVDTTDTLPQDAEAPVPDEQISKTGPDLNNPQQDNDDPVEGE